MIKCVWLTRCTSAHIAHSSGSLIVRYRDFSPVGIDRSIARGVIKSSGSQNHCALSDLPKTRCRSNYHNPEPRTSRMASLEAFEIAAHRAFCSLIVSLAGHCAANACRFIRHDTLYEPFRAGHKNNWFIVTASIVNIFFYHSVLIS